MNSSIPSHRKGLSIREIVIFAMLGTLMAISDLLMEGLPNIHLIGLFIAASTLTYGIKALCRIYVYAFVIGLLSGFGTWWLIYLYAWPILWVSILLIPKRLPRLLIFILVHATVVLHGLVFGVLCAPVVALMWGLDFGGTVAATVAGFSFDLLHAAGNFAFGFLIYPLTVLLEKLTHGKSRYEKT